MVLIPIKQRTETFENTEIAVFQTITLANRIDQIRKYNW